MALVELVVVPRVFHTQPGPVQQALANDVLAQGALYAWIAALALALAVGLTGGFSRVARTVLPWAALAAAIVQTGAIALYRDVLRDQTLLTKGFDVWQRNVVTNWSVVGLFLVLFVAGLGVVGWLVSVVARANRVMETTA